MYTDIPVFDFFNKESYCACESCLNTCPTDCIIMKPLDSNGFLYPQSDMEMYIKCNRCVKACPIINVFDNKLILSTYGGYSNSLREVYDGSSGGLLGTIANEIIKKTKNSLICGVC